MTKKHLELVKMAQRINSMNMLYCEIRVNSEDGFYAIDKYQIDNGKYIGCCSIGTYHKTFHFLSGMLNAAWLSKPF